MAKGSDGDGSIEHAIAVKFDAVLRDMIASGIDLDIQDGLGGAATLVASYLVQTPPRDRAKLLSGTVDAIISAVHSEFETDLHTTH